MHIVVDQSENLSLSSGSDGNVKSELRGLNTTRHQNLILDTTSCCCLLYAWKTVVSPLSVVEDEEEEEIQVGTEPEPYVSS